MVIAEGCRYSDGSEVVGLGDGDDHNDVDNDDEDTDGDKYEINDDVVDAYDDD